MLGSQSVKQIRQTDNKILKYKQTKKKMNIKRRIYGQTDRPINRADRGTYGETDRLINRADNELNILDTLIMENSLFQ